MTAWLLVYPMQELVASIKQISRLHSTLQSPLLPRASLYIDCILHIFFVETTSACTGGGYINSQQKEKFVARCRHAGTITNFTSHNLNVEPDVSTTIQLSSSVACTEQKNDLLK